MRVLAFCRTYFQVAQTLALCEWFKEQGKNPELTIFRGKTSLNKFAIKKEALDFSVNDYPVNMVDLVGLQKSSFLVIPLAVARFILSSFKKNKLQNAIVAPGAPNLYFLSILYDSADDAFAFYSIEEGIGTYGSMLRRAKINMYKSAKSTFYFPLYLIVELAKQLLLRALTYRSGGIVESISSRIISHNTNRVSITPLLKTTLQSDVFSSSKVIIPRNTILFLSTTFVERGIIDEKRYMLLLDDVHNYFKKLGNNFLIKPHPAEKIDKYNEYVTCHFDGPVEAILGANLKNLAGVAGINSTALILAQKLFQLPSYRIEHKYLYPYKKKLTTFYLQRLLDKHTQILQL